MPGHETKDCRAVGDVLNRVGDKWTVLVVSLLGGGSMRFSELRGDRRHLREDADLDPSRPGARRLRDTRRDARLQPGRDGSVGTGVGRPSPSSATITNSASVTFSMRSDR